MYYQRDPLSSNVVAIGTEKNSADIAGAIEWLPKGPKRQLVLGNSVHIDYRHDTQYRLQAIKSELLSLHYDFDPSGNITGVRDANTPTDNKVYEYDKNNRLQREIRASADITYDYDLDGNRSQQTDNRRNNKENTIVTTYRYDQGQVLTQITKGDKVQEVDRDAYGNLSTGHHDGKALTREYNVFNQLIRSTRDGMVTRYGYNANRQRAWKKTGEDLTVFVYDINSEKLLAEYRNGKLDKEYVYLDGELIAIHLGVTEQMLYVQNDHLGRPQVVSDDNKQVVWQADNQSFDREVRVNYIGDLNIGFPGLYYDRESGLYYNINRGYDPETGRYVQSDPIGLLGGLSTYVYAKNNPIKFLDRMGLAYELWFNCKTKTLEVVNVNPLTPPGNRFSRFQSRQ